MSEPTTRRLHKLLVAQAPHKAQRPESRPTVLLTEARRAIGTYRELCEVAAIVVILTTTEERQEAVVRIGGIAPRCNTCTRRYVCQEVVILTLSQDAECLVVIGDTLLTNEEVEVMLVALREAVVRCIGDCERAAIGRRARSRALTLIWQVARIRQAEACCMRVVNCELRTQRQSLDWGCIEIYSREQLVLLECYRVILLPLDRVLADTLPRAVVDRSQRTVSLVWRVVRQHKACSRNWGYQSIRALVGLLNLLVVEHCVGTEFEPSCSLTLQVSTERVTSKARAERSTLLVVVTTRNIVRGLLVSTRNREFIVLQQRSLVIYLVEPAHIGLAQQVVILTLGQTNLLLVLNTLLGVHQVPVVTCNLRKTELHTVVNARAVCLRTTLGGDNDNAVSCTCTID